MRETSADGKYCQMKLKLINRHFEQLKTIHINVKGPIKIERVSLISSVEYFCENNFFIFSPTLLKKRAVIEFFGRGEDFLYIDFYFESEQKDRNRVIFKFREKTVAYNFFDIWRGFPAKKNQIALNKVAWVDF